MNLSYLIFSDAKLELGI